MEATKRVAEDCLVLSWQIDGEATAASAAGVKLRRESNESEDQLVARLRRHLQPTTTGPLMIWLDREAA